MSKIAEKQRKVEFLVKLQNESLFYFFIDLKKIPAKILNSLRQEIKKNGGLLLVTKKTLLQKSGLLPEGIKFNSPLAVVFVKEDDNKILKIINDLQKKYSSQNLGGYIFGFYHHQTLPADFLKQLGNLPSKSDLIGQLVFSLKTLILRLIGVLNSPVNRFIILINKLHSSKTNS